MGSLGFITGAADALAVGAAEALAAGAADALAAGADDALATGAALPSAAAWFVEDAVTVRDPAEEDAVALGTVAVTGEGVGVSDGEHPATPTATPSPPRIRPRNHVEGRACFC